jgi:hypothetical protein
MANEASVRDPWTLAQQSLTYGNTTTTSDYLKSYREAAEKDAAANKQNHACPNCGYCPHCGRGGYWGQPFYPIYPTYPTYPTYPWSPPFTYCGTY